MTVNEQDVSRKTAIEVAEVIRKIAGTITFRLRSAGAAGAPPQGLLQDPFYVMALFDYDPLKDGFLPCVALGLQLHQRDVLQVLNMDDPDFWQATRATEENTAVGLVPSKRMQQRRQAARAAALTVKQQEMNSGTAGKKSGSFIRRLASRLSRRKSANITFSPEDLEPLPPGAEEGYWRAERCMPEATRPRPIVLIGVPGIGRTELKKTLIKQHPERFASVVPHTTRQPREGEVNGRDYCFIDRAAAERQIAAKQFLEHGEYNGNIYGTTFDSVRAIVESARTCILDLHPYSLKHLHRINPTPYVVYAHVCCLRAQTGDVR